MPCAHHLHAAVLGGDHIYKMDYSKMVDFHVENNADCTISVIDVPKAENSSCSHSPVHVPKPPDTSVSFEFTLRYIVTDLAP